MNREINIFKGVYDQDCSNVVSTLSILRAIKSGRWKDSIEQLRLETEKEKIKQLKFALPAVTWSGVFEERVDDACLQYSELMVIDVDNISSKRLKTFREELKNNPWVYSVFAGPTKGVKILVFVDSPIEWHNESAFWSLERDFLDLYGIEIDSSGKNPSRLCFVSYDPELYINESPVYYHVEECSDPLDDFVSIGKTFEYKNGEPIMNAKDIMDRCVKMVSKSKAGSYHKGNRNNFVFVLSCLLCEYGVQPDQALNLIAMRFQSLKFKEVRSTVDSAYRRAKHNFGTKVLNQRGNPNQKSLL